MSYLSKMAEYKLIRKDQLKLAPKHFYLSDVLKKIQCGNMAKFRLADTCDLFVPTPRNCTLHDIHPDVRKFLEGHKLIALHALMDIFGDDTDCAEFQAFFEVDSLEKPTKAKLFIPPRDQITPEEFMITGCHFTVEFSLCENIHVIIPDLCDPSSGFYTDNLFDFNHGPELFKNGVPDFLISPCVEYGADSSKCSTIDEYRDAPDLRTTVNLTSFFRLWFCPSEKEALRLIRTYLRCGLPLCGREHSESA